MESALRVGGPASTDENRGRQLMTLDTDVGQSRRGKGQKWLEPTSHNPSCRLHTPDLCDESHRAKAD